MTGLRLQGFEDNGPANQWVELSHFLPGGGAGPDSTPFEKVYVVLEGEMTVIIDVEETMLGKYDSCTIPPNEVRTFVNRRNDMGLVAIVIMLVAPKGIWGLIRSRFDLQLFPLGYRVESSSSSKKGD